MKLHLYLILTLLTLSLVTATSFSFTTEWAEYGNDARSLNTVQEATTLVGYFDDNTPFSSSISDGSDFQPLLIDVDNDGTKEIIGSDGNYLKIWRYVDNTLSLVDEYNVGATQTVSMSAIQDFDEDEYIEFIAIFNNTDIYVFEFNGTDIIIEQQNQTNFNARTGIRCGKFPQLGCYWGDSDGNIVEYGVLANGFFEYNLTDVEIFEDIENLKSTSPAMYDIDRDGNEELIFVGYSDSNSNYRDTLYVWEQSSADLDTSFSTDGIYTISRTLFNNIYIHSVSIYNVDGSGDNEIIINYYRERESGTYDVDELLILILKADGTEYCTNTYCSSSQNFGYCYSSNHLIGNFNDDGQEQIGIIYSYRNSNNYVRLYNMSDCSAVSYSLTETAQNTYFQSLIAGVSTSANVYTGEETDIITPTYILSFNGTGFVETVLSGSSVDAYTSIADMNNDGSLDIVVQEANYVAVYSADYDNTVPIIDNSLNYGGYGANLDYTRPICVNSTLQFTAQENVNYENDITTDTERIVSDCGLISIDNGTYSLATPTFSCLYNETGTYVVKLYLQDLANPNDFTQYNTQDIIVNVINGEIGSECSFTGFSTGTTGTSTTATETEAIEDAVELMTQGSPIIKLIAGIGIVLSIIISIATVTTNPIAIIMGGLGGMIIVTALGMIPAYILVVLMVMIVIIGLIYFRSGGNS